jgi:hypothetical protein
LREPSAAGIEHPNSVVGPDAKKAYGETDPLETLTVAV